MQSTSWKLAEIIPEVSQALATCSGDVLAELSLKLVEFITKTGREVRYRKPVIKGWSTRRLMHRRRPARDLASRRLSGRYRASHGASGHSSGRVARMTVPAG